MIRFAFSTLLVFAGLVSPSWALGPTPAHQTAATFSSKGGKAVPTPVTTAVAAAKVVVTQKPVVSTIQTITSDLTRAGRAARIASHPQSAPPISTSGSRNSATTSASRSNVLVAEMSDTSAHTATVDAAAPFGERLARVTAYWRGEGDYYTGHSMSATGVRLHEGHCAVDPNIIPYGSVVDIKGVGKFLAVDTGSAVISRTAAREGGQTAAERHAIVVDLYFADRSEGEKFAAGAAKYVSISWWTPSANDSEARAARSLFAEEDWSKIQGKQL